MTRRRLPGFTALDLLVAIIAVGLLAALTLPATLAARVNADAENCADNLRALAQANSFHHDQRGDIVPMGMFSGGISWAGLTLPYLNDSNHRLFREIRFDMRYDAPPNNDMHHLKGPNGSTWHYFCPARRELPQLTNEYPAADYAVPSVGVNKTLDDPKLDGTWMQCHALDDNRGPSLLVFQRHPQHWKKGESSAEAKRYRGQTSFSTLDDGTSHQIFMGEKALHPDGLCKDGKAGDFTFYSFVEKSFNAAGVARPGSGGISPAPDAHKDSVYRRWGSWHAGVCQFAMVDVTVRRLNVRASAKLLASLCDRRDGAKIKLPDDLKTPLDDSAIEQNGE